MTLPAAFTALRDDLKSWLFDRALPLWWDLGADRVNGGFFERIGFDGKPVEAPRRTRVAARQIYTYATAQRMGWQGPALDAVRHGLDWLLTRTIRPDGLVLASTLADGTPVRGDYDFYEHAFVIFACAQAAAVLPNDPRPFEAGKRLRDTMVSAMRHPEIGFEEAVPRVLPLRQNPHMHLLEAVLAFAALPGADDGWRALADEIVHLSLTRFVDPRTGALREFFAGDWTPMPDETGRIVEPGHQFEWTWLLVQWARGRNEPAALAAARRLCEIGETHGVDTGRNVAINEIFDDFSIRNADALLWPQTERVKAHVARAEIAATEAERTAALESAATAARGMAAYLATPVPGLWYNLMKPDGRFAEEAPPVSTLYHLTCAIAEMQRAG